MSSPLWAQSTELPAPELINDKQGLPQGFVSGIVQDRQGFVWMATHDGLCRYDGHQFKVYHARPDDSLTRPFSSLASLQLDHRGRIWVVSEKHEIVVIDPRTETFTNISKQLATLPVPHVNARHYYADRQNRLWLAFDGGGLVCYDLTTRRAHWFRHRANEPHSLGSNHLRSVLQDQQGAIWIATVDAGLERFEEKTGRFLHYRPDSPTPLALPELSIFGLAQRPSGELLLGTFNYVCRFNPKTGQFHAYRLPAKGNPAYGENYLWGIRFVTDSRGVVYCDQRDRLFRLTDEQGLQLLTHLTPKTGFCSGLLIDRSDVLWMGTDGSGIRKYDLRADGFQTARYQTNFQTDLLTNWLHMPAAQASLVRNDNPYTFRYALDGQGSIWANSGSSVFYHINPTTRQAQRVDFPISFVRTLSPMATDPLGRIWVLYLDGLWYYDPVQHQWVRSAHHIDTKRTGQNIQMVVDEQAFWFATETNGLFRQDRQTGQLRQYVHQPNVVTSLSNNSLYCLSADPDDANRLWIGTHGNGLCAFDKRSDQCRRITQQDGLPNNVIYSAIPDQYGNLWIGTNKGLCRMNRKTFQMRTYTVNDGLLANEFNRFHYIHLPGPVPAPRTGRSDGTANDQIIMGGVEGITSFQPARFQVDTFQPKVELTELFINDQVVRAGSHSALHLPIQAINQLSLPYNQNFLTVGFAATQYNRPGTNRYRYRLDGINEGWVETRQTQAIYTALAPGRYTLLVNASNTSGQWSPYVRKLGITVHPPFWATWWAYVLYIMAIAGSIWYGLRLYLSRMQLQQAVELQQQQVEIKQREVELQQQEAQQLRALDEMKTRFFSNVTHDFRTPLTLILSPITGLVQDLSGTRHEKRLTSIGRNARHLLALINQLLDLAKLNARALNVQETWGNLSQFVEQIGQRFEEEAATRDIRLTYQSNVTGDYRFDADKLERILFNLLGNALKFTPAGGQITVSLQPTTAIQLTVSDTGIGIPAEKLPFIFDRFFQGASHAVEEVETGATAVASLPQTGTGIGLSLVKELVELQNGQITVESQVGRGTTFHLSLPYRRTDDVIPPIDAVVQLPATSPTDVTPDVTTESSGEYPLGEHPLGEQPHLLLVEDNAELAEFIADSLPDHYRVSRAANGAEGLELALAELPDLVISDVMMPIMDGYTLCQTLKDDERTSHIPVILLTAKVTLDNRLEGLGRGADDYLTKPFHVQELNLRIHNLLERQRRFRERIVQELVRPGVAEPALVQPEQPSPAVTHPFLEKFYAVVEEKLDDSSFSIEDLAERLNLSRSFLHRKVKALTGLAASDLMRVYRLKRSTQFLCEGFNSSQTAYQVGFDSPQYFAKCFREMYQMTPTEFARQGLNFLKK